MADFLYTDLDPTLIVNPLTGDIGRLTDAQAIMGACKNLILMSSRSRPFQPLLGAGLEYELFEPINIISATNLERRIKTLLLNNEPRIDSIAVSVSLNQKSDGYNILVVISPKSSIQTVSFKVFLSRVL